MTAPLEDQQSGDALTLSPDPVLDFCRATEAFVASQRLHGQALADGNLRDVFVWQNERELSFREIVRNLELLVSSGKLAGDQLRAVLNGLQIVIAGEDELKLQVEARQQELQAQLFSMRRGRGALQGYSLRRGGMSGPRYLSSRT